MKLRNVNVSYIKSKYSYKKIYAGLQSKNAEIFYAGPIIPMESVFSQILRIMRSFMQNQERLSNESRKSLRLLEDMMKDPKHYFTDEGITHIIIYEYVQ